MPFDEVDDEVPQDYPYEQDKNVDLNVASAAGDLEAVKCELRLWRLTNRPSRINAHDLEHALCCAIVAGHPPVVSYLLSEGGEVDPNMILKLDATISMFQYFLNYESDVTQMTDIDCLIWDTDAIEYFLFHGADPTMIGPCGESIITIVAFNSTPKIMYLLVADDWHAREYLLNSDALHIAAVRNPHTGGLDMLYYLLNYQEMDINQIQLKHYRSPERWDRGTVLHSAVAAGNLEAVVMLLDRGADREKNSTSGWTPLDIAVSTGHRFCAEAIKNFRHISCRSDEGNREISQQDFLKERSKDAHAFSLENLLKKRYKDARAFSLDNLLKKRYKDTRAFSLENLLKRKPRKM